MQKRRKEQEKCRFPALVSIAVEKGLNSRNVGTSWRRETVESLVSWTVA